ncbi:hypothetical protein T484DRAFT_1825183, partial [Baffinella frigidus]
MREELDIRSKAEQETRAFLTTEEEGRALLIACPSLVRTSQEDARSLIMREMESRALLFGKDAEIQRLRMQARDAAPSSREVISSRESYGVKGQDTDARGASGAGGKDAEALSAMEKRLTEVMAANERLREQLLEKDQQLEQALGHQEETRSFLLMTEQEETRSFLLMTEHEMSKVKEKEAVAQKQLLFQDDELVDLRLAKQQ